MFKSISLNLSSSLALSCSERFYGAHWASLRSALFELTENQIDINEQCIELFHLAHHQTLCVLYNRLL